jgi:surface polysaccharide O-acyltransferase-like enzyme
VEKSTPEKDLRIETIRGLALLLMVAGHVIGDVATAGMAVADDSFLRYLYNSLVYVRMPLFTAISGYVYALRPITSDMALSRFFQGKARRIVLPLIVVSTLFFFSQMIAPGANAQPDLADFFSIYFFGYAHFWFLQAIFCIFIVVALLDKVGALDTPGKAMAVIALAIAASFGHDMLTRVFSFHRAVELLPFFLLGLSVYRFWSSFTTRTLQICIALILAVSVAMDQAYLWGQTNLSSSEIAVVGTALGLSAIYLLITHRFFFAPFAWLGRYAFEIYLLHVFGTAGTRILLSKINIDNDWIVFFGCLAVGLALPVAVKRAATRWPMADLLLFGARTRAKAPRANPPPKLQAERTRPR